MTTIFTKSTTYSGVACTAKIEDYELALHGAADPNITHVIDYRRDTDSTREHIDFYEGEPADVDIIKS